MQNARAPAINAMNDTSIVLDESSATPSMLIVSGMHPKHASSDETCPAVRQKSLNASKGDTVSCSYFSSSAGVTSAEMGVISSMTKSLFSASARAADSDDARLTSVVPSPVVTQYAIRARKLSW